jgi:hypothetical protein
MASVKELSVGNIDLASKRFKKIANIKVVIIVLVIAILASLILALRNYYYGHFTIVAPTPPTRPVR